MKKLIILSFALFVGVMLYGQRNTNGEYWNTWQYKAKAGMEQEFMDAAAKKTAMFNKTPETAISTYRIATGPDSGMFVRVESGKSAESYDMDRSAEGKYWRDNVIQFVSENEGQVRWRRLSGGSYIADPDRTTPAKYVLRTTYNVKADKIMHFRRFMERIAKVAEERKHKESRFFFRLESGGNRNQFVMATTFDTYKRDVVVRDKTFQEIYLELFGYGTFEEDSLNFDAALEGWGEFRETLVLIPEMTTGLIE